MTKPTPNNPDPVAASTPAGQTPIREGQPGPSLQSPDSAGSGNDSSHSLADEINGSDPITADGPDPDKFPANPHLAHVRRLQQEGRDEQGRFLPARDRRLGSVSRPDSIQK